MCAFLDWCAANHQQSPVQRDLLGAAAGHVFAQGHGRRALSARADPEITSPIGTTASMSAKFMGNSVSESDACTSHGRPVRVAITVLQEASGLGYRVAIGPARFDTPLEDTTREQACSCSAKRSVAMTFSHPFDQYEFVITSTPW